MKGYFIRIEETGKNVFFVPGSFVTYWNDDPAVEMITGYDPQSLANVNERFIKYKKSLEKTDMMISFDDIDNDSLEGISNLVWDNKTEEADEVALEVIASAFDMGNGH